MIGLQSIQELGTYLSANNISLASVVSGLCFITIASHYYYKNFYSYWSKRGINGPKPLPLVGNFLEYVFSDKMKLDRKRIEQFGEVYGTYQGHKPHLYLADPEVLRQICIKDFDVFPNHELSEFSNHYQRGFLFFLQDDHWRRVRALMTPTFTSGKIKRMFKLLDICANDLVGCFREQLIKNDGVTNVKDVYSLYTMDGIATCCYGLKMERKGAASIKSAAPRNKFVEMAMKVFEFNIWRILLFVLLPRKLLLFFKFYLTPLSTFEPLAARVSQLIVVRRSSNKKFDDYLQMLIDTRLEDELELNDMDQQENHHAGLTHESLIEDQKKMVNDLNSNNQRKVEMTDLEVLSSAIFLLIVGVETTGTLLTNASYLLAFHQDIQERLYQEIKAIAELSEDKKQFIFSYESLTSCQYLDAFVSESLRRIPPVIQIDRLASRDYRIEKYNLDIPKGSKINLGLNGLLNNPKYWDEPEKFDPERFMPGNREKIVPGTYVPFGIGPRHCIGMRFSLTEAKLALAKIVMSFRFEPAPGITYPPQFKLNLGLNGLKNPTVKLVERA